MRGVGLRSYARDAASVQHVHHQCGAATGQTAEGNVRDRLVHAAPPICRIWPRRSRERRLLQRLNAGQGMCTRGLLHDGQQLAVPGNALAGSTARGTRRFGAPADFEIHRHAAPTARVQWFLEIPSTTRGMFDKSQYVLSVSVVLAASA
jgi:hypothetical protein